MKIAEPVNDKVKCSELLIHRDPKRQLYNNAVVTVGTFDGIHTGHKKIIEELLAVAKQKNTNAVVITFDPHPRTILNDNRAEIAIINSLEEKIELLKNAGIKDIVIFTFDKNFSQLTEYDFLNKFLIQTVGAGTIIIGYNHKFGHKRKGSFEFLKNHAEQYNITTKEVDKHSLHDNAISSSNIRKAIAEGKIKEANQMLGYEYFLTGQVIEGLKIGRTLGFPTANLRIEIPFKLIPARGAYAVKVVYNNQALTGMCNIGIRPTFEGISESIEVHILDFDKEIYGEKLKIFFTERIRDEIKFDNINALKFQLENDKKKVSELFRG